MRTQYAHTGRCGEPVVKLNSAFECATFTAAEFTCAEHAVGFVCTVSRVHKPIGCFAVVGNKNQPFGVIIQSADRVQSVRQFAEKVGDFNPVFAVRIGTYDIFRLRFLYKGIIIKHNKTEPTYTKTSLFLCEKRRFFMARTEKGVVATI